MYTYIYIYRYIDPYILASKPAAVSAAAAKWRSMRTTYSCKKGSDSIYVYVHIYIQIHIYIYSSVGASGGEGGRGPMPLHTHYLKL